jgi:hypothetical protein
MPLLMEVAHPPGAGNWRRHAVLWPGDQDGSVTNNLPDSLDREILVFRCEQDDRESRIFKVTSGAEAVEGDARIIVAACLEPVATLGPGESHQVTVITDSGLWADIRWTHRDGPP